MDFKRALHLSNKVIIDASKKRGTPIVFMTHGITMRLSGLTQATDMPDVDYKIFPNFHKVRYYKTDKDSDESVKILGAARYCDEWEKIYNQILAKTFPCLDLPNGKDKLKILFFERPIIGLNSKHECYKAIKNLDFVEAVFKERIEKKNPYYETREANYPSARLIQWADVVVMSISSIALEVLWQKKPLLFLKFLSPPGEVCAFDEYKACWAMHSQEELMDAIQTLKNNPSYKPYTDQDVNKLVCDVVYNGDMRKDILRDHMRFFMDIVSRDK
ncbi:MAG: hypothetical protein JW932_14635 [Deltaproteobacteria bacterium]|nr:hypothetical protein [Deltaproteobacteria bacterium]